jgi:hypothetical protein
MLDDRCNAGLLNSDVGLFTCEAVCGNTAVGTSAAPALDIFFVVTFFGASVGLGHWVGLILLMPVLLRDTVASNATTLLGVFGALLVGECDRIYNMFTFAYSTDHLSANATMFAHACIRIIAVKACF